MLTEALSVRWADRGLTPISGEDLGALGALLETRTNLDPFAVSPGYFGMTGRKGLWVYWGRDFFVIIARHPNVEGALLVFPPYGSCDVADAMNEVLCLELFRGEEVHLSRFGPEADFGKLQGYRLSRLGDVVLDWNYPVHVVCPRRILAMEGAEFSKFRNHVSKAEQQGLVSCVVDLAQHEEDLLFLVDKWATDGKKEPFTYDDLTTPTKSLIDLCRDERLTSVVGIVTHDAQHKPVGFWMFDVVGAVAMSLARVSIGHMLGVRGAAEFTARSMASILVERGVDSICLGGSETDSLDRFKKKLLPQLSIELASFEIVRRD